LLSSWDLEFEAIDTEVWMEGLKDLERFGINHPPAVVIGDRAVQGWNPEGIAELVGKQYVEPAKLELKELVRLLDKVLTAAQRAIRQFRTEQLKIMPPGRNRDTRHLGYHIFRVAQAYPNAMERGGFPDGWLEAAPPPEIKDSEDIAEFGQTVRERVAEFVQRKDAFTGEVDSYYGRLKALDFFERTVWHSAQHLRQLYALLESIGITPLDPLPEAEFKLLPLPENLW
jgi:hypothetical protein